MKNTKPVKYVGAFMALAFVTACSTPDRPITSEAEFSPETSTPYVGSMPGSEGPIGQPNPVRTTGASLDEESADMTASDASSDASRTSTADTNASEDLEDMDVASTSNTDETLATNDSQIDDDRVSLFEGNEQQNSANLGGNDLPEYDRMGERETVVTGASTEHSKHHAMKKNKKRTNVSGASSEAAAPVKAKAKSMKKSATVSEAQKLWQKELALNQLHHINQKELAMAKMAKEKSENAQVKSMADQIIADHQQLEEKVKAVSESEQLPLHSYQAATHEAAFMDRLGGLEGNEFDQAFLQSMKKGHNMALRDLQSVQGSAHDPEVVALIKGAIPSIRKHGNMTSGASLAK